MSCRRNVAFPKLFPVRMVGNSPTRSEGEQEGRCATLKLRDILGTPTSLAREAGDELALPRTGRRGSARPTHAIQRGRIGAERHGPGERPGSARRVARTANSSSLSKARTI